ncbi:MAG TPA: transposase [Ignavibacteria bacterium]|nr:transposase [Ignavibacteria bacterium]HMR39560.1 transposase [Ignavibacteria bacterium]
MKYREGQILHVYNQGNNRQKIFFKKINYIYFLKKVRKYIHPYCDILSYCLIPNQFNFLIYANSFTVSKDEKNRYPLSEGLRILLSSYCKGINVQENRTGSLFTQNSHIKCLDTDPYSALACFVYILQKPKKSGYVLNPADWEFSAFKDYAGLRNGTLCNKIKTFNVLGIDSGDIKLFSDSIIPNDLLKSIF